MRKSEKSNSQQQVRARDKKQKKQEIEGVDIFKFKVLGASGAWSDCKIQKLQLRLKMGTKGGD